MRTYLYLDDAQRSGTTWTNLPTLSNSRRECYLTLVHVDLVFDSTQTHESIVLRMNIPTMNYFSSSNNSPVVAMLDVAADKKVYTLMTENQIHLLTNDDLKRCSFSLEDTAGVPITIDADDSLCIMVQLEYIDQEGMTNKYLTEQPKML
jgi:hypothetical protein